MEIWSVVERFVAVECCRSDTSTNRSTMPEGFPRLSKPKLSHICRAQWNSWLWDAVQHQWRCLFPRRPPPVCSIHDRNYGCSVPRFISVYCCYISGGHVAFSLPTAANHFYIWLLLCCCSCIHCRLCHWWSDCMHQSISASCYWRWDVWIRFSQAKTRSDAEDPEGRMHDSVYDALLLQHGKLVMVGSSDSHLVPFGWNEMGQWGDRAQCSLFPPGCLDSSSNQDHRSACIWPDWRRPSCWSMHSWWQWHHVAACSRSCATLCLPWSRHLLPVCRVCGTVPYPNCNETRRHTCRQTGAPDDTYRHIQCALHGPSQCCNCMLLLWAVVACTLVTWLVRSTHRCRQFSLELRAGLCRVYDQVPDGAHSWNYVWLLDLVRKDVAVVAAILLCCALPSFSAECNLMFSVCKNVCNVLCCLYCYCTGVIYQYFFIFILFLHRQNRAMKSAVLLH